MSKPTRNEVVASLEGDLIGRGYSKLVAWSLAADSVLALISKGWLEVAPEPTLEPDDRMECRVEDAAKVIWKPTGKGGCWVQVDGPRYGYWADLPQPVTLYRKVGE